MTEDPITIAVNVDGVEEKRPFLFKKKPKGKRLRESVSEVLWRARKLDGSERGELVLELLRDLNPPVKLIRMLEDYRVLRNVESGCETLSEKEAWGAVRMLHLNWDPDNEEE